MRALNRSLSALTIVEPAGDVLQRWAELRVERSRLGHPLGQKVHDSDRWIAATALA
jgi:predicted nucleic acid-binding protein